MDPIDSLVYSITHAAGQIGPTEEVIKILRECDQKLWDIIDAGPEEADV